MLDLYELKITGIIYQEGSFKCYVEKTVGGKGYSLRNNLDRIVEKVLDITEVYKQPELLTEAQLIGRKLEQTEVVHILPPEIITRWFVDGLRVEILVE